VEVIVLLRAADAERKVMRAMDDACTGHRSSLSARRRSVRAAPARRV
jgi:hypothetical protein